MSRARIHILHEYQQDCDCVLSNPHDVAGAPAGPPSCRQCGRPWLFQGKVLDTIVDREA